MNKTNKRVSLPALANEDRPGFMSGFMCGDADRCTSLELLVVLAIVAALPALWFPVFGLTGSPQQTGVASQANCTKSGGQPCAPATLVYTARAQMQR